MLQKIFLPSMSIKACHVLRSAACLLPMSSHTTTKSQSHGNKVNVFIITNRTEGDYYKIQLSPCSFSPTNWHCCCIAPHLSGWIKNEILTMWSAENENKIHCTAVCLYYILLPLHPARERKSRE